MGDLTNRELLEAAAKAAGLKPFTAWGKTFVMGDGSPSEPEWNPLEDDGDALRLAVKLGIRIERSNRLERSSCDYFDGHQWSEDFAEYDSDPCAATRRAIVRAAAALDAGGA